MGSFSRAAREKDRMRAREPCAVEVEEVRFCWMLTAKLISTKSAVTQGKQCTTAGTAYVLCVRQCAVTVGRLQS